MFPLTRAFFAIIVLLLTVIHIAPYFTESMLPYSSWSPPVSVEAAAAKWRNDFLSRVKKNKKKNKKGKKKGNKYNPNTRCQRIMNIRPDVFRKRYGDLQTCVQAVIQKRGNNRKTKNTKPLEYSVDEKCTRLQQKGKLTTARNIKKFGGTLSGCKTYFTAKRSHGNVSRQKNQKYADDPFNKCKTIQKKNPTSFKKRFGDLRTCTNTIMSKRGGNAKKSRTNYKFTVKEKCDKLFRRNKLTTPSNIKKFGGSFNGCMRYYTAKRS